MASAGRRSELQTLVFDPKYIEFKPKGAGMTFSCGKISNLHRLTNPDWSDFGTPNCPLRALGYYHRHMSEHPELRRSIRNLFIPIKDNNAGNELSAAAISRWICATIVDSHVTLGSKNLPKTVNFLTRWICSP